MRALPLLVLLAAFAAVGTDSVGVGIQQLALAMATECVADATCSAKYVTADAAVLAADFETILASHGFTTATAADMAALPLSPGVLLGLASDLDVTCVDAAIYASSRSLVFLTVITSVVSAFAVTVFVALFVLMILRSKRK